jgi:hypothetical protein
MLGGRPAWPTAHVASQEKTWVAYYRVFRSSEAWARLYFEAITYL